MSDSTITEQLKKTTEVLSSAMQHEYLDCFTSSFWGRFSIDKLTEMFQDYPVLNFRDCDGAQVIWNHHTAEGGPLIVNVNKIPDGRVVGQAFTIEGVGTKFANVMLLDWMPVLALLDQLPGLDF